MVVFVRPAVAIQLYENADHRVCVPIISCGLLV